MQIESLLSEWNGETVVVRYDRPTGAWIFIAIHSTRLGPAGGGTRMKSYPDPRAALEDAMRLAAGMTYKFASSGIPKGGAKAVIDIPADLDPQLRPALLRRYGALVRQLGGLYSTGPDVGTSAADMNVIAETGAPYVFGRTPEAGGCGDTGQMTALGVFTGVQVACEWLFDAPGLRGRRVLVQGAGSVGAALIAQLRDAGAEVLFSDVDPTAVRRFRDEAGLKFVPPEAVYETECDVFAPCAMGGALNERTIPQLRCRAVAGGANNQLASPEDAERLRSRGILYAPDYVVNSGGAIGAIGIETLGWSRQQAEKEITASVGQSLRQIFELATAEGLTTEAVARRVAEARLSDQGASGFLAIES
jgi:leucine dehydrogenase